MHHLGKHLLVVIALFSFSLSQSIYDTSFVSGHDSLSQDEIDSIQTLSPAEQEELRRHSEETPIPNGDIEKSDTPIANPEDDVEQQVEDEQTESVLNDENDVSDEIISPNDMIFGRQLFSAELVDDGYHETPDSYVISPGDEVYFRFWGRVNNDTKYRVTNNGVIYLTPLGRSIHVAGQEYGELKNRIDQLSKAHPNLEGQVSVTSTHPIKVHFSGFAVNPGSKLIPAYYTFWQALQSSGGPSTLGSIRNIQLIRQGENILTLDVYDLLIKGESPQMALRDNDIIHFGEIENVVDVFGLVKNPGKFEMKDDENLGDLVEYASGIKNGSVLPEVVIERFLSFENVFAGEATSEVIDISLIGNSWVTTDLCDGDQIYSRDAEESIRNEIFITGSGITVPGRYALNDDTRTLQQLITKAGGLVEGYFSTAELITDNSNERSSSEVVELSEASSILLTANDHIIISSKLDVLDDISVEIDGFVRTPLTITATESISLYSLLSRSHGVQTGGISYVHVISSDEFGMSSYAKYDISDSSLTKNVLLKNRDKVIAYDYNSFHEVFPVTVLAYGDEPILLPYSENLNLDIAIHQLQGLHPYVDSSNVEFVYPDFTNVVGLSHTVTHSIEEANFDSTLINPSTLIIIRKDPNKSAPEYVTITGEVRAPGRYPLGTKLDNLSEIITRSGGFSERANPYSLSIVREGENIPVSITMGRHQNFRLGSDWILQDNDIVQIKRDPNSVAIEGAVFGASPILPYVDNYNWREYIENTAGGFLDTADVRKSYIVYPNGATFRARRRVDIVPGSKIIVPLKPYKEPVVREEVDWGDVAKMIGAITSSILTAVTLIVVVKE